MAGRLIDLLRSEASADVKAAALEALKEMGIEDQIPVRSVKEYHGSTLQRLEEAESELFRESKTDVMRKLNKERVAILTSHIGVGKLELVLKRRFAFEIDREVKGLVDRIATESGDGPPETELALAVLRDSASIDDWLSLLMTSPDDYAALAAAHRLERVANSIPIKQLGELIATDLPPDRLCAVAEIVAASKQPDAAVKLDKKVRAMLGTVSGPAAVEAIARLTLAVMAIENRRGVLLAAVADSIFWTSRVSRANPGLFPWSRVYDRLISERESGDYDLLFGSGDDDDARAAVHMLFSAGAVRILVASGVSPSTILPKNVGRFRQLAESETDASWQLFYAGAATQIQATDMLPWLCRIADRPEHLTTSAHYSEENFGEFFESTAGFVLRAVGYLASVAKEEKSAETSVPAIDYLRHRCSKLHEDSNDGERAGTVTGLGFVGEWGPILTWLRGGEPWLHRAAWNVVRRHIPQDTATLTVVARWIADRLGTPGLHPEVRSTLTEIKTELEGKCGRLFPSEKPSEND